MDLLPIDRALRRYACAVPPLPVCLGLLVRFRATNIRPSTVALLRGFGTVGLASTNGQAEVTRDSPQPRGISTTVKRPIQYRCAGQLHGFRNSRGCHTGRQSLQPVGDNFAPEVTEAFVRYEPNAYLGNRAAVVSVLTFSCAAIRDWSHAQPTVRPNIDYYASHPMTLDGVNIQLTVPFGDGLVRGEAYGASQKNPFPGPAISNQGRANLRWKS